jgi:predicted dehydrogenase
MTVSSYIPFWHPYEDFRELYACKKDLGGGVLLTEIHEFDLCIWYFGRPVSVTCLGGTYSNEGLDVEDTARVILDYENFLVQVNLTFWQKHIERSVFISGEDGCLSWSQDGNSLIINNYQNNSEVTKDVEMNNDSMFNSQVKDVLTSASDKSSINLNDSYLSIAIVMAAKKSMEEKRTINMDEINNDK